MFGFLRYLLVYFVCLISLPVAAGILPAPKKISDHVYAWIGPLDGPSKENNGYRMNMAFVVGKKSVAVIDTGYTVAMAREAVAHIKNITSKPIRYAINGNSQPHRFMGNDVYHQLGAKVIAHEKTVQRMKQQAGNFANAITRILELPADQVKIPRLPNKVITQSLSLDLGGLKIDIIPLGTAHTPMQLGVKVAADKIMYVGDLLYSQRLLSVLADSNIASWISTYDSLKKYGNIMFIPGHGPPAKLAAFEFSTRQYLDLLLNHMDKMVEEGVDAQDAIARLDQSAYSKLVVFDVLSGRNASWAYLERESAAFE